MTGMIEKETKAPRITLKPSLLVGASIGRQGGVKYTRENGEHVEEGDFESKTWTTTRIVDHKTELKTADAVASECRRMIRAVCYPSAFGAVCAKEREPELDVAIREVRKKIDAANTGLSICTLTSAFIKGTIASADQEAAAAIISEIGTFMAMLQGSIESCDVKKIRSTVAQMKGLETLLPDVQSQTLLSAVAAAKKAASFIVRESSKKGREIEQIKRELDLSEIDVARVLFVETETPEAAPIVVPDDTEAGDRLAALEV